MATVKFKLTNGGVEAIGLDPASTLLTYSDEDNLVTLVRSADVTGSAETSPWWYSNWQLGAGNSLDSGEVVEIIVGLFTAVDSTTTINEGATFTAADTTLTVLDGTQFTVGDTIYIDSEQASVTVIAVNDLTVTRGANGSTATTHADATPISLVKSALVSALATNVPFKVELIPPQGAPFTLTRTTPVEIKSIMDLG